MDRIPGRKTKIYREIVQRFLDSSYEMAEIYLKTEVTPRTLYRGIRSAIIAMKVSDKVWRTMSGGKVYLYRETTKVGENGN